MEILVRVEGQRLSVQDNRKYFVEGTQEFVKFTFDLDEDWRDLTVFAQFIQNDEAYNIYLDNEDSVFLPPEIEAGTCRLLLYGTGGTVRGTTNCLLLTIDENILIADGQSTEITQSLYEQLVDLVMSISSVEFLGITTTSLSNGSTVNPITINGRSVTARAGDIAVYSQKVFLYDGSAWRGAGGGGGGGGDNLGALAYKDSASGSFTPAGSVSQPTFSGNQLTLSGNFTPSGNVTISKGTGTANYTPEGSVSQPNFTGSSTTFTGNFTPAGSVTITKAASGTANYTPQGTVTAPTITVTPATGTVNSITSVGTLPTLTTTVTGKNLTLGFSQGTLPTKGNDQTVVTGIQSATATQPTFTGTGAKLEGSFSGTQGSVSVSGTPNGSVSQPTFTGTGVKLQGSFSGTQGSVSVSGTPSGTVTKPTFTGTSGTVTVE